MSDTEQTDETNEDSELLDMLVDEAPETETESETPAEPEAEATAEAEAEATETEAAAPDGETAESETDTDATRSKPPEGLLEERGKRQLAESQVEFYKQQIANIQQPATQQEQPQPLQPPVFDDLEPEKSFAALQAFNTQQMQQLATSFQQSNLAQAEQTMRSIHDDYDAVVDAYAIEASKDPIKLAALQAAPFPASYAYEQGKAMQATATPAQQVDVQAIEKAAIEKYLAQQGRPSVPKSQAQGNSAAPARKKVIDLNDASASEIWTN